MTARRLPPIRLEPVSLRREAEFLAAVRRSARLHAPWVQPPDTQESFRRYIERQDGSTHLGWFVVTEEDELAGVINASEVVRGAFQSAYLGYYGFSGLDGRGFMSAGLRAVISEAFRLHGLHRLEANIQPENRASIALVRRLGFRKEGLSPRYLKIRGRWRDHERWAILREDWPATRTSRRADSG